MKFIAKTLYGLENVLADELKTLGALEIKPVNRAVLFSGPAELMYRVNYCSRTALSVLRQADSFMISSKDDLYKKAMMTDWSRLMDAGSTFSVVPVVNSKLFTHTGYPALVLKDAIADHFRNRTGRRPSVNTKSPDIIINLHISGDRADISVDSSGEPLFKRGYRTGQPPAPLNEVLAAGIILMSGWDASTAFIDPMCGSGTFPIEAGLIACHIPPGRFRKEFGFMKWKDYDEALFRKVRENYDKLIRKPTVSVSGSDISEEAVKQSIVNIRNAGLSDDVNVTVADFRDLNPPASPGYLFINPPYGERLKPEYLSELYSTLGTLLKHRYTGFRAFIITPGKELLALIGLRPGTKKILFNGSIECILAGFELYQGSKRQHGAVKSP